MDVAATIIPGVPGSWVLKGVDKVTDASKTNVFNIAQKGGKHAGFLKNYSSRSRAEIEKGIRSLEKQIEKHKNKINNPQNVKNFGELDKKKQVDLIRNKWPSDIARQQEQLNILQGLLKSKQK